MAYYTNTVPSSELLSTITLCKLWNFLNAKTFYPSHFKTARYPQQGKHGHPKSGHITFSSSTAMTYPIFQSMQTTSIQRFFATNRMWYYICILTYTPSAILLLIFFFFFFQKSVALILKNSCLQPLLRTLDHIAYESN